jgi:predicted ArsR family transcriptional regulator
MMAGFVLKRYTFKTMPSSHRVRRIEELRALASPERQELVLAMQGRPALSVRELAELLGRLPVSLYYHLRELERVGLVVCTGTRPSEKGAEALYRLPARGLTIRPDARGPAEVAALRKIGAGVFRRAQRLHDALVAEQPARARTRREHVLAQRTVRLDAAGLERVNTLLLALADELQRTPSAADGPFYTVTLHLARDAGRG